MLTDSCSQLGDTSLPLEQPEMLDDDFLKSLHHVLFEVRFGGVPVILFTFADHPPVDPRRRRYHALP
jgi:hypothetical protein